MTNDPQSPDPTVIDDKSQHVDARGRYRNPWVFVPVLYFLSGLPYIIVTEFSVTLFKTLALANPHLGINNAQITWWLGQLAWPWTIKMLWGPFVDLTMTRRRWFLAMQVLLAATLFAASFAIDTPNWFTLLMILFGVVAVLSATNDIATDGFYILALSRRDQALFVGIRSTFYRLAMIFGGGVLVWIAGRVGRLSNDPTQGWSMALMAAAGFFLGFLINAVAAPKPISDRPRPRDQVDGVRFVDAFVSYFRQPGIFGIIAFLIFYRVNEVLVGRISRLFLQDPREAGGLGLSVESIGFIQGIVGVVALLAGGILGGYLVAQFGLKRLIWPMMLAMHVPNLLYLWASVAGFGAREVMGLIAVDQFGYGFGFAAYMVFLLVVSRNSPYPTAHYAISTGIMGTVPLFIGMYSGTLQGALGYTNYFLLVIVLSIPAMLTFFLVDLDRDAGRGMRGEEVG